MNFILCNHCGYLFSRLSRACPSCSRTDFSYYKDPGDPELLAKQKALTGKTAPGSPITGLLYIAAAVIVAGGAGTLYGILTGINPHVVRTETTRSVAASPGSIPN